MPFVTLNPQYFSPLFNASLLYEKKGEDFDPQEGERTTLAISLDDLEKISVTYEDDLYSVSDNVVGLLQALFGDEFESLPILNNVLSVTYIGDSPKYIKTPIITKRQNDKGEDIVGLLIGDDKSEGGVYQFFPLVVQENRLVFEGTKALQLGLDNLEIKTTDKSYRIPLVTIPHPDRKTKLIYQLPIQVKADTDYANFQLSWNNLTSLDEEEATEAWNDVKDMISSGVSANTKLNQIFSNLMAQGTFPKKGVILPVTSVIKIGKVEKKDGKGSFFQAVFGMDTSGFPGVSVSGYLGGDSDDIPLNTIGSISCFERDQMGALARTNKIKEQPPTALRPWYLYIAGANAKGTKIPEHSVFTGELPKKYKELLEEQKKIEYWVF